MTRSRAIRLAEHLLLQDGELSIADIEAMPFVENPQVAEEIAMELASQYNAEWRQRRIRREGVSFWEDYVRL